MRRRDVLPLLAAAAASWPATPRTQDTLPLVGFLTAIAEADRPYLVPALLEGLEEEGHVEGRDVRVEYRWAAGNYGRLESLAQELLDMDAAVIIADSTPATLAARAIAGAPPIVFLIGSDPIRKGFVESLNRPGGNLTGFLLVNTDLTAKRTGLLLELVPTAQAIALLVNPSNPSVEVHKEEFGRVTGARDLKTQILEASQDSEIDAAFAGLAQLDDVLLVVQSDAFFDSRRQRFIELARQHAVPVIYQWREFAEAGGLVSYGVNLLEAYRSLGNLAGAVLSGQNPADLPVRVASKFEMVVNLETAHQLGIDVPPSILLQADEVIE